MLIQNNADLDSERKALMDNVSQLLSQYQELLAISLEDKKHFHEEEKNYTERVHSLKRQKEKLEEKIMEHYKKSETTVQKKYVLDILWSIPHLLSLSLYLLHRKPFASSLVRRVKKASSDLMNKVPSRVSTSFLLPWLLSNLFFTLDRIVALGLMMHATIHSLSLAPNLAAMSRTIAMRSRCPLPPIRIYCSAIFPCVRVCNGKRSEEVENIMLYMA